jgi:ketol-acid reductoisomerase
MTIVYFEEDGNLGHLANQRLAVVGYGNMGRALALNIRDSGLAVTIAVHTDATRIRAEGEGFATLPIEAITQASDCLILMLPDETMPSIYLNTISPHLSSRHTLIFTSGYNLAHRFIEPPPFVDVGLIAPRTFGEATRERFLDGSGYHSFIAAGQDASGHLWDTMLAVAMAMGALKAGAVETTIEQETELDLFLQQAILPAVHHILITAANLLLERGYPPEAVMMDLYVSGELNDYIARAARSGLLHALEQASLTAYYGTVSRLDRFKELKLERLMEKTLDEIRDGAFAREWRNEYDNGYPRLRRFLKDQESLELWDLEQQTIEMLDTSD